MGCFEPAAVRVGVIERDAVVMRKVREGEGLRKEVKGGCGETGMGGEGRRMRN
jgi:hypothetical protein